MPLLSVSELSLTSLLEDCVTSASVVFPDLTLSDLTSCFGTDSDKEDASSFDTAPSSGTSLL